MPILRQPKTMYAKHKTKSAASIYLFHPNSHQYVYLVN